MTETAATVVICDACKSRVAEIVADDGRKLCSKCHLVTLNGGRDQRRASKTDR